MLKNLPSTMNFKPPLSEIDKLVAARTLRLCSVNGSAELYILVWRGEIKNVIYDSFNFCISSSDVNNEDLQELENFFYNHLTK